MGHWSGMGTCRNHATWRYNVHVRGVVGKNLKAFRYHGEPRSPICCKKVILEHPDVSLRNGTETIEAGPGGYLIVTPQRNNQGIDIQRR